jgi:hypothetical protein
MSLLFLPNWKSCVLPEERALASASTAKKKRSYKYKTISAQKGGSVPEYDRDPG